MGESRITALREHPRRAGRYVVELNGEALGAASVELISDLQLAVGRVVDAALRERLDIGLRAVACFDRALNALASRSRSRSDLARWLRQREFTTGEIEPTLERLEALGLLDDLAFARGFARSRLGTGRGFGPRRVAAELARRGVARAVVDEVFGELRAEGLADETASIELVAGKKWRTMRALEPAVARRRLYGFLSRRGFSDAAIRQVLAALGREA